MKRERERTRKMSGVDDDRQLVECEREREREKRKWWRRTINDKDSVIQYQKYMDRKLYKDDGFPSDRPPVG